ncbi:MAG: hypothetical protein Q8942_20160, partial [Bacillota bacterium]|nr:hypothetical protein [Bacillota bacterium]
MKRIALVFLSLSLILTACNSKASNKESATATSSPVIETAAPSANTEKVEFSKETYPKIDGST